MALAVACGTVTAAPPQGERDPLSVDFSALPPTTSTLPGPPNNNVTLRLAATLTRSLPRDWLVKASVNTIYSSTGLTLEQTLAPSAATSLHLLAQRDYLRDGGFGGNVELHSPDLCSAMLRHCRALLFYDHNYIRYNRNLNGQLRSGSVGSVGVGFRMQLNKGSNLQFDYGRVVRSDQMPDDARNRLSLRLGYSF
jgi:hemolysin activation/secretion protein